MTTTASDRPDVPEGASSAVEECADVAEVVFADVVAVFAVDFAVDLAVVFVAVEVPVRDESAASLVDVERVRAVLSGLVLSGLVVVDDPFGDDFVAAGVVGFRDVVGGATTVISVWRGFECVVEDASVPEPAACASVLSEDVTLATGPVDDPGAPEPGSAESPELLQPADPTASRQIAASAAADRVIAWCR